MVLGKTGAENRRQKMESIYGAGFWRVCNRYYLLLPAPRDSRVTCRCYPDDRRSPHDLFV